MVAQEGTKEAISKKRHGGSPTIPLPLRRKPVLVKYQRVQIAYFSGHPNRNPPKPLVLGQKDKKGMGKCIRNRFFLGNARKNNSKYKNKSHCLIQFNYWLEARLGIKTTKSRSRMRNQFCKEMVKLTKELPLTAWDEFKRRHPKLYEKRYKERWERERRPKR